MNKDILEKRIERQAQQRFDDELKEFAEFVFKNDIAENLMINLGDGKPISLYEYGPNYAILNSTLLFDYEYDDKEQFSKYSNGFELREKLMEKYKKEEFDALFNKLDQIEYMCSLSEEK